jgi:hypothetical protein
MTKKLFKVTLVFKSDAADEDAGDPRRALYKDTIEIMAFSEAHAKNLVRNQMGMEGRSQEIAQVEQVA